MATLLELLVDELDGGRRQRATPYLTEGYYWIRMLDSSWHVAYYSPSDAEWYFAGEDAAYCDIAPEYIGPRINEPEIH